MSCAKDLAYPSDTIFTYDGSLAGFFCCVFESVYTKKLPAEILPEAEAQPSLLEEIYIDTDGGKAERVMQSIPIKISYRALELIENVFLSCLSQKEIKMLRFLLHGYREGPKATDMLGHPDVAPLIKAEKHLLGEAHLLTGFIRFSDYDGILAATISPKNFVLPFITRHFVERYNTEQFMIYDKTHKHALVYQDKRPELVQMDNVRFPEVSEEERKYRELWKRFYKTIAIEARENPRCRMTHMPKRYWENMVEMVEYL